MNPLGELLKTDDIVLDLDVPDKNELLRRISELLAKRHGLNGATVFESLQAREALGSTGIGHGVAIPHARMNSIPAALALLVRTRSPIAFGSPDGKPVSNVLTLLVPKQASQRHLDLLASAATLLSDSSFRDELTRCESCGAARWLFARWPDSHSGERNAGAER